MKTHFVRYGGLVVIAAVCIATAAIYVYAQRDETRGVSESMPRTVDGKPDLTGLWTGTVAAPRRQVIDEQGNIKVDGTARDASPVNSERDATLARRASPNKPIYKPEYWAKVHNLDLNRNNVDSFFACMPAGIPRMGPPNKIVQTRSEIVFLWEGGNPFSTYRVIPMDGKPHHPERSLEPSWLGDSIGRWDGDTLVIETVGQNTETWIAHPGYFHTEDMRVTERLTREGNLLHYDATVEDPAVLTEPYVLERQTVRLNTLPWEDAYAVMWGGVPCIERDQEYLTTNERH